MLPLAGCICGGGGVRQQLNCAVLNGYQLQCDNVELVTTFLTLAAGELRVEDLAAWFRAHVVAA